MFNENEDPYRYDVQILEYEKLTRDTFDMNSLSRISDSISRKHGQSTHISHAATLHRSSPTRKTAKGRHSIDKKRRPLVTSIACRSRLCQLGSSPHVTCGCSTIPSNKCSEQNGMVKNLCKLQTTYTLGTGAVRSIACFIQFCTLRTGQQQCTKGSQSSF